MICKCGTESRPGVKISMCFAHVLKLIGTPEELKKWELPLSREALKIQARKRRQVKP